MVGKQRYRRLTCWQVTSYHMEDKCLRDTTAGQSVVYYSHESKQTVQDPQLIMCMCVTLFISDDCKTLLQKY